MDTELNILEGALFRGRRYTLHVGHLVVVHHLKVVVDKVEHKLYVFKGSRGFVGKQSWPVGLRNISSTVHAIKNNVHVASFVLEECVSPNEAMVVVDMGNVNCVEALHTVLFELS